MNAMKVLENSHHILNDLTEILDGVNQEQIETVLSDILNAENIFVAAAGRSFLMMKAFAMRLMHMGFPVFVVGEIVTPAIRKGDLLLTGSGSGETATLKIIAEKAKKAGAKLDVLTIYQDSSIARLSDGVLVIPAATNQVKDDRTSWQPGGSSFEQSLLILLDSMAISLASELGIPLSGTLELHANLE